MSFRLHFQPCGALFESIDEDVNQAVLLAVLTADHTRVEFRGTAFGVINWVRGVMLFVASLLAGVLWSNFGTQTIFDRGGVGRNKDLCRRGSRRTP